MSDQVHKYDRYSLHIQWRIPDEVYQASVPELPGCQADGATYEEAAENVLKEVKRWVDAHEAESQPIPAPNLYDSKEIA